MRVGSLFSGIGGIEYGLERSGLVTSHEWMIEMNDYCCSVLEKNFPNSLVINDKIENINPLDLPKIDVLTAGFPCQPVSTAGSRKGVTDERWLWDEVWRFIDVLRPRYFILENVPGLFTANKGEAFARVIKDITESRSYRFEWQIVSARSVGAAHLRKRFFGVGILADTEHNGSSTTEDRGSIGERSVSWRQGEEVQEKNVGESKGESKDMEYTTSESNTQTNKQLRSISTSREKELNIGDGVRREESRDDRQEAELWMGRQTNGFPRWMARLGMTNVWQHTLDSFPTAAARDWKDTYGTVHTGSKSSERKTLPLEIFRQLRDRIIDFALWEYGMPRSAEDYPNRKQILMALGNAVVPQCAELVGRLILRADQQGGLVFDCDIKQEEV
jgi:DNA-cytosine methyltransferase